MNRQFFKTSQARDVALLAMGIAIYGALVYFLKIPCPVYYVTGISCPGCGMTRALFALLRLDFSKAMYYNPMIFLCFPLFIALAYVHIKQNRVARKIIGAIFIILLVATYLYRLCILKSPVIHFTPENGIFVRLFNFIIDKIVG